MFQTCDIINSHASKHNFALAIVHTKRNARPVADYKFVSFHRLNPWFLNKMIVNYSYCLLPWLRYDFSAAGVIACIHLCNTRQIRRSCRAKLSCSAEPEHSLWLLHILANVDYLFGTIETDRIRWAVVFWMFGNRSK